VCLEEIKSEPASSIERYIFRVPLTKKISRYQSIHYSGYDIITIYQSFILHFYPKNSPKWLITYSRQVSRNILTPELYSKRDTFAKNKSAQIQNHRGSNARGLFSSAIRAMSFLRNAELRITRRMYDWWTTVAFLANDAVKIYLLFLFFSLSLLPPSTLSLLRLFSELGYIAPIPRGH